MSAAHDAVEVRHELLERLAEARSRTDEIFAIVRPDFLYERPIPERHRIIFYIGHLEAFDWNLLRERALGVDSFHPEYDRLFAFGIDPVDGGLPADQPSDWPRVAEVQSYVRRIRQTLDARLAGGLLCDDKPVVEEGYPASALVQVAIEHRLMHAETLAYMLHQLPLDRKILQPQAPEIVVSGLAPKMIEVPAGPAMLGLARGANGFGWDNEYEAHRVDVPEFAIDQCKVTNGEYLQFMAAGGYEDRSLWTDAAWNWKTACDLGHTVFWRRQGDNWFLRAMFEEIPLPLNWPVYVSQAEASAFARWAGKALPTEAQWQRAAYGTPGGDARAYPWGNAAPSARRGNFDFQRWDPTPVGAFPQGESAFGVADLMGNGWEWTSTVFAPFPGFRPFSFYSGYSANFFDGQHYVMKGGSPRTAACMLRRSFRNWFQPHYQYVYAGFRCVRSK
ncbi:MAG TPA: SUMF1/EgtB/PvdO family nonheme iron enzyme [Terriglobales bacterium]|jgi:ergothioneine biosynthesis protein EgtB|nr:SUMF1/EgtB/PvdO family nonheme iron enzyme [Terriglobales bacterium]